LALNHQTTTNVKGNLNVLSVERKITRASIVRTIRSAPIVVNLTWLHPKIVNISLEKKKSDRVLNQFAMSLWRTFGELTF
jgi:hypothetical protein